MEEHGMFVETSVAENERNEHEDYLRMAIKVRIDLFWNKLNKLLFKLAEENVHHGLGGPFGGKFLSNIYLPFYDVFDFLSGDLQRR
jgi:hypothetical protein